MRFQLFLFLLTIGITAFSQKDKKPLLEQYGLPEVATVSKPVKTIWTVPHPPGLTDRFAARIPSSDIFRGEPTQDQIEAYFEQVTPAYGHTAQEHFQKFIGGFLLPFLAVLCLTSIQVVSSKNHVSKGSVWRKKSHPVYLGSALALIAAFLTYGLYKGSMGDFALLMEYTAFYQLGYLAATIAFLFLCFRVLSNRGNLQPIQKVLLSLGFAGAIMLALNKLNELAFESGFQDYSFPESLSDNPFNWLAFGAIVFGFSYYLFGKSKSTSSQTIQGRGEPV